MSQSHIDPRMNGSLWIRARQAKFNQIAYDCKTTCYHIEHSELTRGQRKAAYVKAYANRDKQLAELK